MEVDKYLKNCPFCGKNVEMKLSDTYQTEFWGRFQLGYIVCNNCNLLFSQRNAENRSNFVQRWNSRNACAFDENKNPLILVEDGSVDTEELKKMNLRVIVYKQGAKMPIVIKGNNK